MRMMGVQARQLFFLLEFTQEELEKLVTALDGTELVYDDKDPKKVEAIKYLTEVVYTRAAHLVDTAETAGDDTDAYYAEGTELRPQS